MLRIKRIHIKNFRSIVNCTINVRQMNIFVGLNDAGKSNVLKALNLFFNGETEPGDKFDFDIDYSRFATIRNRKAKEVYISIEIEIPMQYKDHEDVVWTKTWRRNGLHYDSSKEWSFSAYSKVPTLLNRISYKYVPAVKSDNYFKMLLSELYLSIAKEANGDLTRKAREYSTALNDYTNRIGQLVKENIGIDSGLVMPANQVDIFKELIFMTQDASGASINLAYRGEGIKSMHIPAILKYIAERDNRNLGSNAVPFTPIWGYEEPENGVEMMKCFQLAKELFGFSDEIQQFITTHSPGFYQLGAENKAKLFYVRKDNANYASIIDENSDVRDVHEKIGILPIVTPLIKEKESELKAEIERLKNIMKNTKLVDRDTIFVEGITDKQYLLDAIEVLSPKLQQKLMDNSLKIETREENGCGVSVLCDWAVAWIHSNYGSKAVFLFDHDEAGMKAKSTIGQEKQKYSKKKFNLSAITIQPTDDMKKINSKINNSLSFEIEHLLSYDFWRELIKQSCVQKKTVLELAPIYNNLLTIEKSPGELIDEIVDNKEMRDTIIFYNPMEAKKKQIVEYARQYGAQVNKNVYAGFYNTIKKLEAEFGV